MLDIDDINETDESDETDAEVTFSPDEIDPGRLFDEVVHRGSDITAVAPIGESDEDNGEWEVVGRPRSTILPQNLPPDALVVRRALGEGRLASLLLIDRDVTRQALYGRDGRLRADVLIIVRRRPEQRRAISRAVVLAAEAPEADNENSEQDLSFLRWSPDTRAGRFPARAQTAIGGRAFMAKIAGEKTPVRPAEWAKRENAIVAELVAGNMPDALLRWVPIPITHKGKTGTLNGVFEVLPDYLAVGHDGDYVHVPLDPVSAQFVADKFDSILPTAKMCHAIYLATTGPNRLVAKPRDYFEANPQRKIAAKDRDQDASAAYLEHTLAVQADLRKAGVKPGQLIAGHKKDVVIAARLHHRPERIAFQGFYDEKGFPREPCYENKEGRPAPSCDKTQPTLAHSRRFSDYSQGVRLVNPWMTVNGTRKMVADVLAHADESWLISSEGPIAPARIPRTTKPPLGALEALDETLDFDPGGVGELEIIEQTPVRTGAVTIAAASNLGSERSASPIATLSPQRQINELLDRELILLARARVLADWFATKISTTYGAILADRPLMARLDVSRDKALLQRLRPFPQSKIPKRRGQLFTDDATQTAMLKPPVDAAGLQPIIEVLNYYGVVLVPDKSQPAQSSTGILASITRVEAKLDRGRFDTQIGAVEQRIQKIKQDIAHTGRLHHCVERESIPADFSAAPTGTTLEVARPVVALLRRLRALNATWRAGTYPGHWWNDFSIDIFVSAAVRKEDGFWDRGKMRDFFRALNTACNDDSGPGKFAWKGIYNDAPLAREMDGLYGAGRVLSGVDGHGPGPRMHVHLDVRPLTVPFDASTGFRLDGARIVPSPAVMPAPSPPRGGSKEDVEYGEGSEAVPARGRGRFRHDPLGGDAGDNVELRWNVDETTTAGSTVDIAVYLHGYGAPRTDFLAAKTQTAGVDLLDANGGVKVRRSRPTLVIVPRGRAGGGSRWFFDTLKDKAAFDALIDAGLGWLAANGLKPNPPATLARGKLTLMAHSGGGAGMSALLKSGVNPDELMCFDSIYGNEDAVRMWAENRIASPLASSSGLRVFYTPCGPGSWTFWTSDNRWHLSSTEVSSRRVQQAIARALEQTTDAALTPRFRVERTSVGHNDIPARYAPLLLENIAATVPQASPAPPATTRPACVENHDWLTNAPKRPGGDLR